MFISIQPSPLKDIDELSKYILLRFFLDSTLKYNNVIIWSSVGEDIKWNFANNCDKSNLKAALTLKYTSGSKMIPQNFVLFKDDQTLIDKIQKSLHAYVNQGVRKLNIEELKVLNAINFRLKRKFESFKPYLHIGKNPKFEYVNDANKPIEVLLKGDSFKSPLDITFDNYYYNKSDESDLFLNDVNIKLPLFKGCIKKTIIENNKYLLYGDDKFITEAPLIDLYELEELVKVLNMYIRAYNFEDDWVPLYDLYDY